MEKKELICICCPLGCLLTVTMEGGKLEVTGNSCLRGEDYAKKEVLKPTRIVTSSVRVEGGASPMVSVKTERDVPKDKIVDIMKEIRQAKISAPVKIGDTVIENCGGTGVAVIATKNINQCQF